VGIRTGREYLDSLRDGRAVFIDGERVDDVTTDPRLKGGAHTVAALYDLQHQPGAKEEVTYTSPTSGEPVALSYLEPRSVADLVRRRKAFARNMAEVHGLMGRSPDFLNTLIASFASAQSVFDDSASGKALGKNVRAFYELCREGDLAMTHVLVNPQVDRSKPVWEQGARDFAAKVTRETDAGFYVSGARMIATLAQYSNEILVLPSGIVPNDPKGADYCLGFSVPTASRGLSIICRPSVAPQNAASFHDYPLSLRLDEGDAFIIFDNVFVPWERAFIHRDPPLCNTIYQKTFTGNAMAHQSVTRALAKTEFMCGLATKIAQSTNVDAFLHVKGMLARMYMDRDTIQAILETAEQQALTTPWGTVAPSAVMLHAVQVDFHERLDFFINVLRTVGAGTLVGMPSYAELSGPVGEYVEKFFQSAEADSDYRIRLMRLANDASLSAFSGRQQLYERYYQGDPVRARARYYDNHPLKEQMAAKIDATLESDKIWVDRLGMSG
jgi:4-hydroxyphenylacetate 3-monooxygenase